MITNSDSPSFAPDQAMALGREKLASDADSIYRLRFLGGRWVIYRRGRLIANFPAENIALAIDFLGLKQSEQPQCS